MKKGLRFVVAAVPFVALAAVACGGSEPPPPQPPAPPVPQIEPPSLPVVDAGAVDAAPVAVTPALPAPTVVASRQGTVRALAVDGRWLYWVTQGGDVKRTQIGSGSVLKVATFGPFSSTLAVMDGMIYVSEFDSKKKACTLHKIDPNLSNKPEAIATQAGSLCDVVADAKRVAWGVQNGKKYAISVWEKGAKAPTKLTPADATMGDDLALGPDAVYFDDGAAIMSIPIKGGAKAKQVALLPAPAVAADMTFAGDRLFVIAQNNGPTDFENETLLAMPGAGGDLTAVVKSDSLLGNFACDGASLFWSSSGTKAKSFKDGKVVKLALTAGATPVTLADNQDEPHGVAVDDESVYFVNDKGDSNDNDSDVVKVAK